MTNKECVNCMYAIDGVCCLENIAAIKQPECPHKEGTFSTLSVC